MCASFALLMFSICLADLCGAKRAKTDERSAQPCADVCQELPADDAEPACMIHSRYKKGYQLFVNLCHARRTICEARTVMHLVHPSRCLRSRLFFMPIN